MTSDLFKPMNVYMPKFDPSSVATVYGFDLLVFYQTTAGNPKIQYWRTCSSHSYLHFRDFSQKHSFQVVCKNSYVIDLLPLITIRRVVERQLLLALFHCLLFSNN